MKTDLTIYGHLVLDRLYDGYEKKNALGGIANCWRALSIMSPEMSVEVQPLAIGEALIYIDRVHNQRISNAIINKQDVPFEYYDSKMYHIAYLNDLKDLSFLRQLKGTVFADVCSLKFDLGALQFVDYFFISDEDAEHDVTFYGTLARKGAILHSPKGSMFSDGKKIKQFVVPDECYIDNVNVLGAGDMFASSVIYGMYQNKSIDECIENAHFLTSELIKQQNEKI